MSKYIVNIDRIWSEDITVVAKNKREANKKAWSKFIKRKINKSDYRIYIDNLD